MAFGKKKKGKNPDTVTVAVNLAEGKLVADQNLVEGVVILGRESKDATGRVTKRYTDKAFEAALRVFDGAPAYVNHPRKTALREERSVLDMYGFYTNVRVSDDRVKGDLKLFDNEVGRHVAGIIETRPDLVGNSIHAAGKVRMQGRVALVEDIYPRNMWGRPVTVDLVTDPATTKSLFESKQNPKETNMLENLTLTELRESRPDLLDKMLAEGKSARDTEVTELKESVKTLTSDKEALIKELTELKESIEANKSKAAIDALLAESKLPERALTAAFKDQLYALKESKRDGKPYSIEDQAAALIEDRQLLCGVKVEKKGGVKDNGAARNITESRDNDAPTGDAGKVLGSLDAFKA